MLSTALVLAEQLDGSPRAAALELVSAARRLAARVEAAVYGPGSAGCAGVLGSHGAVRCHDLGDQGDSLVAPRVAAALAGLVASIRPDAVLLPATTGGRDLAARLSARIDRPVLANVVGLALDGDGRLLAEHAAFGGTVAVTARFTGDGPGIVLVRPKSFVPEDVGGPPAELVAASLPDAGGADAARVLERRPGGVSGPSLEDAAVVVAGGRGLGEPGRYALVERLAALLHGAPAASRAIVDAGWVPYAYQVGQTGKTVKPEIYLAFGISGATQHLVGMRDAHHVVAVNKDPAAPIFEVADLGVVGDANEILQRLVTALEERAPG